jgi:hypothetical protein
MGLCSTGPFGPLLNWPIRAPSTYEARAQTAAAREPCGNCSHRSRRCQAHDPLSAAVASSPCSRPVPEPAQRRNSRPHTPATSPAYAAWRGVRPETTCPWQSRIICNTGMLAKLRRFARIAGTCAPAGVASFTRRLEAEVPAIQLPGEVVKLEGSLLHRPGTSKFLGSSSVVPAIACAVAGILCARNAREASAALGSTRPCRACGSPGRSSSCARPPRQSPAQPQ